MQAVAKADVGIQLTSRTTRDTSVGQTPRPQSAGPPVAPARSVPAVMQSSGTSAAAASFREQMLQAQREAPRPQLASSELPAYVSRPRSQPSLVGTSASSSPLLARSDSETAATATDAIRTRALAVIDEYKREHAMAAGVPQSRATPHGRSTTDARQARDWRVSTSAATAADEPGTYDGVLGTRRLGEEASGSSDGDGADRRSSSHSTSSLGSEALAALVLGGRSRGDVDHSSWNGDAVRSSQSRPVAPVRGLSQPPPSASSSRALGAQNDDDGFRLRPDSAARSGSARTSAERGALLLSSPTSAHPPPSLRSSSSAATQKVAVGTSSSARLGSGHAGGKKGRTPEQALHPAPGGPTATGSTQKVQWPRSARF